MRKLVGDEYMVIGEVNVLTDKIEIRHNTCGHIQIFKVSDFLMGLRCEKCYHKTSHKKLTIMLKVYSGDRYQIVGHDNYRYILYDNEAHKKIHMMSKHVIQEILRPTPSPLLPVENRVNIEKTFATWDIWYQLCIAYKNELGYLCPEHNEKYKGQALGYRCSERRIRFNEGLLSEDKIQFNPTFFNRRK